MSSNDAIRNEAFEEGKQADTDHEVLGAIEKRWSPRAFADRPVESEKLRQMMEAARWAASSYNEQPWRYIVARKGDNSSYSAVLNCLNDFNRKWAHQAPVLMLSFYKKTFTENGNENRCAPHDVGAASAQLTAQATVLGLYVHQMAGIEKDVIRQTFTVPADFEPMAALAVGYLGDPSTLPDEIEEQEYGDRERLDLSEFVFETEWENASSLLGE